VYNRLQDPQIQPKRGSLDDLALQNQRSSEDFGNDDDDNKDPAAAYSQVEDVWIVQQFIKALKNADINNGDLFPDAVNNLFNPPKYPLELDNEVDVDLIECLQLFFHGHNSAKHYNQTIHDLKMHHPEDDLLSFDQLKHTIWQLTGITPIINDMFPNSCLAYTGPLREWNSCHCCGQDCLDPVTGKA
ncbi:hypothetical protein H0H87_000818, partial [Tephrocybe sp. NHM501043]